MTGPSQRFAGSNLPLADQRELDPLLDEFEAACERGDGPRIEEFLARASDHLRHIAFRELLAVEWVHCLKQGYTIHEASYRQRFPEFENDIDAAASCRRELRGQSGASTDDWSHHDTDLEVSTDREPVPPRLGRYEVRRVLGEGAFGRVLLAWDPEIERRVALKVPTPRLWQTGMSKEAFLNEARGAGNLKHPLLVTVHAVEEDGGLAFIVQEYVEGQNLDHWRRGRKLGYREIVQILIDVCAALGAAHAEGVFHRDLKPANLLMDEQGRPHVADFGLAVRERLRLREGSRRAGTPAYMSPEQVHGYNHRLDGRTDLWSVGVIFYELLTGQRPFKGADLLRNIRSVEPQPPRQLTPEIPEELQRICLKCLQKRTRDRYITADDLRQDLQLWLDDEDLQTKQAAQAKEPARVVPKGLRSFDEADADFFLDLLPGPRDRDGLPESIRFWKTKIEERDRDKTFSLGLLYGPSGCGKSSLVNAGLLPRLSADVNVVVVEATADDTEVRLIKRCHDLAPELPGAELPELFRQLRELGLPNRGKLLIVLDQFEQWLHTHKSEQDQQLVQALTHCDGARVQCLLLVRDDFWMSITRFMQTLEIPLLEGQNSAAVDLFDPDHATKVLTAVGRAYGKLPDDELTAEQNIFLEQALAGLADDGKIISVRLAVFAQMMQGRPWTPASLQEVGGTAGLGVTFLEETFSARSAPPQYRVHEDGVRAVLEALLPESGTGIKGQMRSREQLMEAAEYGDRPSEFDALLGILDREVRLITPTEPDATGRRHVQAGGVARDQEDLTEPASVFYQLTHDYLVPSLREWLTRKQRETRRGRAELRLADLAAAWNRQPENRHLPSLFEFVGIRRLTRRDRWTDTERRLMRRAGKVWGTRLGWACAAIVLVLVAGLFTADQVREQHKATRAKGLVETLLAAEVQEVPQIIEDIRSYRRWAVPLLEELLTNAPQTDVDRRQQLHARAALSVWDESHVDLLLDELLRPTLSDARYVGIVTAALAPYQDRILQRLWQTLHDREAAENERFRAGLTLAGYAPEAQDWTEDDDRFLVEHLVSSDAEYQPEYRHYLRPRHQTLAHHLVTAFTEGESAEQVAAAKGIADFFPDRTELLAELIVEATPDQYAILHPLLRNASEDIRQGWLELARKEPAADLPPLDRVMLGRRRAGAAITMLRQGARESIFDVFRVTVDPESLTQFVHGCRDRGVIPAELLDCLDRADAARQAMHGEPRKMQDRVMFGLLLALGEFRLDQMPPDRRESLVVQLHRWHATDPSSGIHGATGWLLRQWGREDLAREVDQTPVPYEPGREWYTMEIKVVSRNFFVELEDSIFFTFIVFPPGEYLMGSPENEPNREFHEVLHRVSLTRPVAVSDREVTWEQFDPMGTYHREAWERQDNREYGPTEPAFAVTWFETVAYCRWLTKQVGLPESEQCYEDPQDLEQDSEGNPTDWPLDLHGRGFRLLTEAEWEYVCRSATGSAFSFGNDIDRLQHYGWYDDNAGESWYAVGATRPNLRGLFDVHGNLDEWCHDWYESITEAGTEPRADAVVINPVGPDGGLFRIYRGGFWDDVASYCRSAGRYRSRPDYRGSDVGFRLALTLPEQASERQRAAGP